MNRILSDLLIIGTFSIATQSNDSSFLLNRSGNIGVNNSLPSAKFHIKSSGTQSNFAVKIDNQISKPLFYVRDDANVGIASQSTDRTRLLISQYLDYTTTQRVKGSSIILDSFTVSLTNNVKSTGLEIGIGQNSKSNGGVDDITNSYDKSAIFAYLNDFNALDKNRTLTLFEGKIYSDWINNPELVDSPDLNKIGMDVYIYGNGLLNGQKIVLEANPATDSYFGLPGNNPMVGSSIVMYPNKETSDYAIGQSIAISSDSLSTKNVIGMEVILTNTATNSYGIYIDALAGVSNESGKAIFVKKGTSIFNYDSNANTDFIINGQSTAGLFYVDASADSIGIGTSSPAYRIEVLGTVSSTGFRMTNGASSSYLMISDSQGNASWTSSTSLGFVTASGTINYLPKWESSNGLSSTSNVYDDGTVVMIGATDSSLWSDIGASLPSFGKFAVYANPGSLETYGIVSTSVANGSLHVPGNNYAFYANPSGTARMYGFYANLTASNPSRTKHGFYANVSGQGSTNYGYYSEVINASNNVGYYAIMSSTNSSSNIGVSIQMSSTTGSNTGIYIDSSGSSQSYGIRVNKGTSIFNEFGDANTDFQIEGDTQPYLFFVDASTDNIGIRTESPSQSLHVMGSSRIQRTGTNSYYNLGYNSAIEGQFLTNSTSGSSINFGVYGISKPTGLAADSNSFFIGIGGIALYDRDTQFRPNFNGTGLSGGRMIGIQGLLAYRNTVGGGTSSGGTSIQATLANTTAGFTVSNMAAFRANWSNFEPNNGYTEDYYGYFMADDFSNGNATNIRRRWGVYINDPQAHNVLFGTVSIGDTTNTYKLNVTGTVSATNFRMNSASSGYNPRWNSLGSLTATSSIYDDGNNVGIGTITPSYKLDILGTASTTGFRMTNGSATNSILISNGTGDASWSTLSSLNIATGSGTSNYLPRWTSTTALSSTSSLYDDGIDVGIATTSVGRGRLSIVPRGASAAVYISNTTNNSYITYRANTATYSMGVDYDATNPYFAISGGPSSYTTGALGSFDRMRLYNDSMHLIINATSSTVGPASVSNIRKGELVISNFNSISSAHTGKAYTSVILVGGTTTTTIARELKTDGVTASSNKITIPTDTTSAFVVNIQGQSDSNSTTCYFATIRGLVQNYTSSLTILGSTTSIVYNDMSGSASVSVDGTSLQILAQTTTSQTSRWVARVEMTTLTQIGEIP